MKKNKIKPGEFDFEYKEYEITEEEKRLFPIEIPYDVKLSEHVKQCTLSLFYSLGHNIEEVKDENGNTTSIILTLRKKEEEW